MHRSSASPTQRVAGTGMSIASARRAIGLLACLASVTLCQAQEPDVAWWYEIQFPPDKESVGRISASQLNADWRRVKGLSLQLLGDRVSSAAVREFEQSALRFQIDQDLDGDGTPERAFVGTFAHSDGSTGRFLTILRDEQVVATFSETGPPGFSALLIENDLLRWYKCMQCGEYDSIQARSGTFYLE